MVKKITIVSTKIAHEPSIEDMKEFGLKFSKEIWADLCKNKDFVNAASSDLDSAQKIADEIINK